MSRGSRDGGAGWGGRQDRSLYVPAEQVWELQEHLPTGRRLPVSGRTDLNEHRPLGDAVYDDVLTGLKYDDRLLATALSRPSFQVSLTDQKAGRAIVIATDTLFREFVVFAPDHRAVVALEPYTCATDALNLAARGIDAGLRVLRPNWPWRGGHMVIEPAT